MSAAGPVWERLIEAAERKRDACAERLQRVVAVRDGARNKLDALLGYRRDYEARLARACTSGIDGHALRNFQAFLAQLERAVAQQRDVVGAAERDVHDATRSFREERGRVESYQALDDRRSERAARRDRMREQKQTDEWAARSALHARPSAR